ncbi:hypothetical protein HBI70_088520 [Parastagonospora nodorum]|nr:hypothetical protein HBH51_157750 [Parastagonospora nodorum]KAH4070339.1 hypothetical protein HBH50_097530 [Parastagonospora nodorum]KAH4090903.1 hypothetical protein HBH48_101300 [Parastagonospora nodorum]KAH4260481.1 hypothetical protein HBI03_127100 [Parastagonospora nodorum]KAH4267956.1 hypothetical protein HBI04_167020 [Parastagonospora nodorum]
MQPVAFTARYLSELRELTARNPIDAAKAFITPLSLETVEWEGPRLGVFLEDCVIRNWGGDAVVDHELGTGEMFRTKFAKAMAFSLQWRHDGAMLLERCLGEEV